MKNFALPVSLTNVSDMKEQVDLVLVQQELVAKYSQPSCTHLHWLPLVKSETSIYLNNQNIEFTNND